MIQKLFKVDKKTFILSFIIVFIVLSLGLLAATMILQSEANREQRIKADISERSLVETERFFIKYKINRLASDLQFINDTVQQHFEKGGDYEHLEELWLAYSNSRKVYDQIRYLDADGNEIIRVDYSPDGAFVVPQDQLQNKKERYYFQHTIGLNKNQLYISTLDLNMEHGAIELPINPVIRFAQPFFDANGVKQGIIILNYAANDMLSQIASVAAGSQGEVYLLNNDSFWLYHSRASYKEWSFSYNPDSTVKFSSYYPKEWNLISAGGTGTMTTSNGYFTYAAIPYNTISQLDSTTMEITSEPDYWYVVGFIPKTLENNKYPSSNIFDLARYSLIQYFPLYFLVLFISLVLAGLITVSRAKSKEVKFFSEYDVMTNSYNRHAGIDKLSDLYNSLSKSNCSVSICFIDINGLKEINDTLGHESGDELIITVAKTIRSCIRANDFLVRLGGDEFLIVFQGIEEETAEDVWTRIVEEFNKINTNENRKYLISVSHGIESLTCNVNQLLDNVLHLADAKMYDEKRRIKANLQIIRK
ncbi:MAG: hypothetical protein CVV04_01900 [Firmicutes bacterium HGW-Firmicutes-9]|jgi:diguanylate cyclase (GGDEF)-like protein|nr:MAG: hypothetical protein CVV04_01900 [Firmicutes bacterium HGW-Firmicutes-9]